jgi:hypothetical protein
LDHPGAVFGYPSIALKAQHLRAGFLAQCLYRAGHTRLTAREDRHLRAFARKRSGDAVADAIASAADDGDSAFELEIHQRFKLPRKASAFL